MKSFNKIYVLFILILIICSCSEGDDSPSVSTEDEIVYVAGWVGKAAVYWKNEEIEYLTDGTKLAEAHSIYVSGDDVYVAGCEENSSGTSVAKYWKNGKEVSLSNGTDNAEAESIIVSEGNIYVSGYEGKFAMLWKNGNAIKLAGSANASGSYNYTEGTSVFVSGNDIYVAICEDIMGKVSTAKYWKNGTLINVGNGLQKSYAYSIYVSGNDVFVAGEEKTSSGGYKAKYWKNGEGIDLTDGKSDAWVQSMYVTGDDVYICGGEENASGGDIAKYWKNGAAVVLPGIDSEDFFVANSIFVLDHNVYVTGWFEEATGGPAIYWKNGECIYLTGGKTNAGAYSIFVK